jgi:phosphoglycerol transferase MdoB-like AlkP superfamily enzyme
MLSESRAMGNGNGPGIRSGAPVARWRSIARAAIALAAALIACTALILWRDPAFGFAEMPDLGVAQIALNIVPAVLVGLLLFGLTGRALTAGWIVLLALWLVYLFDHLKLHELGTPLMPGDVLLLSNLGEHGSLLLTRYLPFDARHLFEAALAITMLLLLLRRERPAIGWCSRLATATVASALAVSLVAGTPPWRSLYDSVGAFNAWQPDAHARRFGLFAHLLRYRWQTAGPLPEPDYHAAERLLARHRNARSAPTSPGEPPDIVILQSESFFDAARLRGIEDADVLPHYRALSAIARHGDLWVPTFAGGTIRTEFEVLTGIAMRYFPATQYPYFRLTTMPLPSLASVLAASGYRTLAIHPHDRAFWNRASTFANLGFGAFDAEEQFEDAPLQGYYPSDAALVDRVLERLDDAKGPTFVFAISMENHGPYEDYPNADIARRAAEPAPSSLSSGAKQSLRGYLYHAENADRELGRLADALRSRSRRTLLLFYGDHLPGLPVVYREAGFDDGAAANEEPVPWLLLDTADTAPHERFDTAAFYLPALVLDVAGVRDAYFSLLDAMRREDRVGRRWVPADDAGLGALMQLRQQGAFETLIAGSAQSETAPAAPLTPP